MKRTAFWTIAALVLVLGLVLSCQPARTPKLRPCCRYGGASRPAHKLLLQLKSLPPKA